MKLFLRSFFALTAIVGLLASTSAGAGDRLKKETPFDKCFQKNMKETLSLSVMPSSCSKLKKKSDRIKCSEIETQCALTGMRDFIGKQPNNKVQQAKGKVEIGEAEIQENQTKPSDEPSVGFKESCESGDCEK